MVAPRVAPRRAVVAGRRRNNPAWPVLGLDGLSLAGVAFVHTAAAFLMLAFFVVHVYFATTGHTWTSHIKAMITGYEEVETN